MQSKVNSLMQYAMGFGYMALEKQSNAREHLESVGLQTLQEILQQNAQTEYGKKYNFANIHSAEQYAREVPLSTYRVYKPYIERILREGSRNLLCTEELTGWAMTSATSGNMKYIPQNHSTGSLYVQDFGLRGMALADQEFFRKTGEHIESGHLLLMMGGSVRYEGGTEEREALPVASISASSMLRSEGEMHPLAIPPIRLLTGGSASVVDSDYLYLRFALQCRDLIYAASIYDDYIYGILRYLKRNWRMLCDEIESGQCQIEDLEDQELDLIKADPKRAKELREILQDGLKEDTIHRIWPGLQLVSAASKVGVFLKGTNIRYYLKGISYDNSPYGATESMFGLAVEPGDDRLMLLPYMCYFEFIPKSQVGLDNPETLTIDQLKDNEVYELVITTRAGLYRYRIGDLLRVIGRKGKCPLFRFEGRNGVGIDLASEKSPEDALRNALIVAAIHCRISLIGSNMYGEGERFLKDGSSSLRYVVQFETKRLLTDEELNRFAEEIDHQICSIIKNYASYRRSETFLPLRVEQLRHGSYEAYDAEARKNRANPDQYKRPFIMKLGE